MLVPIATSSEEIQIYLGQNSAMRNLLTDACNYLGPPICLSLDLPWLISRECLGH